MMRKTGMQRKMSRCIASALCASLLLAGCGSSAQEAATEKTDLPEVVEEKAADEQVTEQAAEQELETPVVKDGTPQLAPDAIETYFEWAPVEGADGYEVTCENKFCDSETYGDAEKVETKEPNYTAGAQDDFDFRIQVRAYRGEGSDRIYSEWSDYAEGKTYGEEVDRLIREDNENGEGAQTDGMANPWRECTQEEATQACPRLFKVPDGAEAVRWSIMDSAKDEASNTGELIQLNFTLDGMDFCARAQYGAAEDAEIHGLYYDWTVSSDVTLANWGEGHMQGKSYRAVDDLGYMDLITWYDIEIGISYSLSVGAKDLDGFDLQAIAEQMYAPENEVKVD